MIIKIDDFYSLELGKDCVTLRYKEETDTVNTKTNKKIINNDLWYYPNIQIALKAYIKKSLVGSVDINEVLDKISKLENKIDNICI